MPYAALGSHHPSPFLPPGYRSSSRHAQAPAHAQRFATRCLHLAEPQEASPQPCSQPKAAQRDHRRSFVGMPYASSLVLDMPDMVQGKLVNETRCLQCETTTSRQEAFYELSLEIEQNSSLSTCLRNFRQGWPAPCALSSATLHGKQILLYRLQPQTLISRAC